MCCRHDSVFAQTRSTNNSITLDSWFSLCVRIIFCTNQHSDTNAMSTAQLKNVPVNMNHG